MGRLDSELWRFKLRGSLIRHLPLTLRAFHDVNLLDYLLTSVHVFGVFIHISGLFVLQARGVSAKAL